MKFKYYDASDEADSKEGFDEIQDGLRAMFNEDIAPLVIELYGPDDEIALNEEFNNWTDSLCKDGDISDYVYNNVTRNDD